MSDNLKARIDIAANVGGLDTVRKLREEIAKLIDANKKLEGGTGLASLAGLGSKMEQLAAAVDKISLGKLASQLKEVNPQFAAMDGHLTKLAGKLTTHADLVKSVANAYGGLSKAVASASIAEPRVAAAPAAASTVVSGKKTSGTFAYDPERRDVVLAQDRARVEDNRRNLAEWDKLRAAEYRAEQLAAQNITVLRRESKAQALRDENAARVSAKAAAKAVAADRAAEAKAASTAAKNAWDAETALELRAAANLTALKRATQAQHKIDTAGANASTLAAQKAFNSQTLAVQKAAYAQQDTLNREHARKTAEAARNMQSVLSGPKIPNMTGLASTGMLAAYGTAGQVKQTVDAGISIQGTKASLLAATGDTDKASAAFNKLLAITDRWGISLAAVKDAYPKMLLAAKSAGDELGKSGEQTTAAANHIFEAIAKTSTALHLNREQVNGVTKAFEQMLSKGTVSAEELRNQLGDRLAGTMPLAAKAIDKKVAELDSLLRKKQISSYQFTILLAEEMNKQFEKSAQSASTQMQATLNRMSNQVLVARAEIGEAGLFDGITKAAKTFGDALGDEKAMTGVKELSKSLGDLIARMAEATREAMRFYGEHSKTINEVAKWGALLLGAAVGIKAIKFLFGDLATLLISVVSWGGKAVTGIIAIGEAGAMAMGGLAPFLATLTGIAAAAAAVGNAVKQARDAMSFKDQVERFNSPSKVDYTNLESLKAEKAYLEKLKADYKASDIAKKTGGKDRQQALGELNSRLDNIDLAIVQHGLKTAKATLDDITSFGDVKNMPLAQTGGVITKPEKDKGRGATTNTESAVRAAEMAFNKQVWQAEKAELDYQLQQKLISYEKYAADRKAIKAKEMAEDLADLTRERQSAKTDEQRRVVDIRIEGLKYAAKQESLEVDRQLAENSQKLKDDQAQLGIDLLKEQNKTLSAANAEIDKQYADVRATLLANGMKDGVAIIDALINTKRAKANLDEIQRQVSAASAKFDVQDAEIKKQLVAGSLTVLEAEQKSLAVAKEKAKVQLQLLETMDRTVMSEQQQADLDRQIVELKTQLITKTQTQQTIENDVSTGMAQAVADIATGTKDAEKSITDLITNVRAALNKMMTDVLAQQLKKAMFGEGSNNSWLGKAASFAVGTAMDWMGMGNGSTATANVADNMGAMATGGVANVGGQSYVGGSTIQNFNWNVNATDANSFNSQSTVRQSAFQAKLAMG